jgi:YVTN family beta-propeller protein
VTIDIATRKVTGEIFLYGFPRVMVGSQNDKTIYQTMRWLNGVLAVDIGKQKVTQWVELPLSEKFPKDGAASHGLALTPDGKYLYVTSQILNNVTVISTADLKIVREIPAGSNPNWIEFAPDGKYAYVSNTDSSDVSVIDVDKGQAVKQIPVGIKPKRLAVGEI